MKILQTKNFTYYLNDKGRFHREDGPAKIVKFNEHNWYEIWFVDGLVHRENEPAVFYFNNGKCYGKEYYFNGKWFEKINTNEEWFKKVKELKWENLLK